MPDAITVPRDAQRERQKPGPELVLPWSGPPPRRVLIDSDNHYPHHDPRHQAAKLAFAADVGVDVWFNLGDHYDFNALSTFDHDPEHSTTLQAEFDAGVEYWHEVCRIAKKVEYLQGNHEHRLYKTIMHNPGLFKLRAMENLHALMGIPDKVKIHPYGTQRQVGLIWGEHGDQIRAQNPTLWAMNHRAGRVIVFGHTHRVGAYYKTLRSESGAIIRREVWNTGHGSCVKTAARWAGTTPAWQHGFLYAEHYEVSRGVWGVNVHPVLSDGGTFSFRGKVYRG